MVAHLNYTDTALLNYTPNATMFIIVFNYYRIVFIIYIYHNTKMKTDSLTRGLSKNRWDDGTTTGQDEASLPQLAAISCRRRVEGTA